MEAFTPEIKHDQCVVMSELIPKRFNTVWKDPYKVYNMKRVSVLLQLHHLNNRTRWVQGDSIKLYHQLPERPSYYPTDQDQQEPTIKAQDQDIPSQLCHQIPDDLEHQDFYLNFLPTQQTFSQGWREWGKIKIRNLFKMNKMGPGPSRRTRRASS